jgi:uncharacterized protein DUF551
MKDPSLWRSITSAPQDGTEVLVFVNGHVAVAIWTEGRWQAIVAGQRVSDAAGGVDLSTPTHWRPLPPPPGSMELLHT